MKAGTKKYFIVLRYVVIVLFALVSLFPIFVMITTAFKTRAQVFSVPPVLFFKPTLNNFEYVVLHYNFVRYFINSLTITLASTFLAVSIGALSGYALARFKFMGKGVVATGTLFLRMIPPVILIIPLFIMWNSIGLVNSRFGLIFAYVALNIPFNIWVLRTFIADLPVEIEESAVIDGCSEIGIFTRIIIPLISPGLAVASIFTFRISWNEFPMALVLTNRYTRTLPVSISLYMTETGIEWGQITAMATVIALPAFIFTFAAAKSLIMGLTAGAVKG